MADFSLPKNTILRSGNYTYRIVRSLGHGSFGITYLAEIIDAAGNSTQLVCIKEFFMSDVNGRNGSDVTNSSENGIVSSYRKKFVKEAYHLSSIRHENVVKVIETFEANNTVYYSMSYISGGSLDEMIGKMKRIPEAQAFEITAKVAYALGSLHKKGMLHLDLKPGNIMMLGGTEPILIDFGLSKTFSDDGEPESSTKIGGGTPSYAPLEQENYRPTGDVPASMDVYALGATLFKMLTGERPPIASDILNYGFPDQMLRSKGVSDKARHILKKAMSPTKNGRYQTMAEFADALRSDFVKNEGVVENTVYGYTQAQQPVNNMGEYQQRSRTVQPRMQPPVQQQPVTQKSKSGSIWAVLLGIIGGLIVVLMVILFIGATKNDIVPVEVDQTEELAADSVSTDAQAETVANAQAEEAKPSDEEAKDYDGSVALDLNGDMAGFPICLKLKISDGNVTGTYYNIKYKVQYTITGSAYDENLDLTLTNGSSTCRMYLYNDGNGYTGTCEAEGPGKSLEVNLR